VFYLKREKKLFENQRNLTTTENPYQENAPWPTMRGDTMNTGRSKNLQWKNLGITPKIIHFRTGNAIFSTPIIDREERIYVGSADRQFYAFDPHEGEELWRTTIGGIVDSAGCIDKDGTVYVAAGDGKIHAYNPDGTEKWSYDILKNRVRNQFTFSTNYWFEGNIVIGPDDAIYVANDDFFLYKFSKSGKPLWGFQTGFLIWSACAFGKDGNVYLAGFDHLLYALDIKTGKLKWKTDLGGSMVSSSAIGEDGTIFQGAFNGKMYAVNPKNGKIKWVVDTGSHIYASPAVSFDNIIYFGSTNGTFCAVDGTNGQIKWTYYIGDAIRSSASIGPDPENKDPYLIYFGGGDGLVYALDPTGNLRWSYDTLLQALNTDYPGINASIALGDNGLAVASSTGDVIWISYDYYLKEDASGISTKHKLEGGKQGAVWHYITPGGRLEAIPLEAEPLIIDPTNIISLRLLLHDNARVVPLRVKPNSISLENTPQFHYTIELQSDSSTINIIPSEILTPETDYSVTIKAAYVDPARKTIFITNQLCLRTRPAPHEASILSEDTHPFKIIHMAIPQPRIIPSLDQIGLASLSIPFSIVESDPEKKRFVAWAVQKFGDEGVPQRRISLYAFSGTVDEDYFLMEAHNCLFEVTSFYIPLDLFRISGLLKPDSTVAVGGSLLIDKFLGLSLIGILRTFGSNSPLTPKNLIKSLRSSGLVPFLKASRTFLPSLLRQFSSNTFSVWGLLNQKQKIVGVGTFHLESLPNEKDTVLEGVTVQKFKAEPSKRQVVAEVNIPVIKKGWDKVICILLVDKTSGKALPINYRTAMKYKILGRGKTRALLSIPKFIPIQPNNTRAYLMVDLYSIGKLDF